MYQVEAHPLADDEVHLSATAVIRPPFPFDRRATGPQAFSAAFVSAAANSVGPTGPSALCS
jgi:hypothetical protein